MRWLVWLPIDYGPRDLYISHINLGIGETMTESELSKLTTFIIRLITDHIVDAAYRHMDADSAVAFLADFDASFKGLDADELRCRALAGLATG